nr:SRPBCC family protein [Saprospiraceae bacterium]
MSIYSKKWQTWIDSDLDSVWAFFSNPKNLDRITPEEMNFEILSESDPGQMYEGMIISYRVRPLFKIPTTWVTEITRIKPKKYFVDEQRIGPYKMWHHEHHFEEKEDGVLMTDLLSYALPVAPIGNLIAGKFISNKVENIFNFRNEAIAKYFPERKN